MHAHHSWFITMAIGLRKISQSVESLSCMTLLPHNHSISASAHMYIMKDSLRKSSTL